MGTEIKDLHDRLYVRDYNYLSNLLQKNYKSEGKLSHKVINNGIVLPCKRSQDGRMLGGVCDEKFNFIAGSATKATRSNKAISYGIINGAYEVSKSELEHVNEVVVYGGSMIMSFYESLFLYWPAFNWWHVKNPSHNYKVVFVGFGCLFSQHPALRQRVIDLMELINIKEDRLIFCDKPTQFEQVIVPDTSVCSIHDFYEEYAELYNSIVKNANRSDHKKIYLTRRNYTKKENIPDCINEEYFENFYKEKGFEIISPEKYSIKEQVEMYAGADEIVSVLASATLSAATFSKPGTRLVCLNRIDVYVEWAYIDFAFAVQVSKPDYYVIDICYNFLPQCLDFGASLLGPTKNWRDYVKKTYNEEIEIDKEKLLDKFSYQYIKNWISLLNPHWFKIYGERFDVFDIVRKISQVFLDNDISRSEFTAGPTKMELKRQVNELNSKNASLEKQIAEYKQLLQNLSDIYERIGKITSLLSAGSDSKK